MKSKSRLLIPFAAVALLACKPKTTEAPVAQNADCSSCEKERAALEAKVAALGDLQRSQQKIYDDLRQKLAALTEAGSLRIQIRRGLVVLELRNKVLFDLGKAQLKPEGKEALTAVGEALAGVENRRFLVSGHTDNVPVLKRSQKFKSNWELSAMRSLAALNVLLDAGMGPESIGVAGFGEFDPIADNSGDEGRAENRRTEIVVLPDLSALLSTATTSTTAARPE